MRHDYPMISSVSVKTFACTSHGRRLSKHFVSNGQKHSRKSEAKRIGGAGTQARVEFSASIGANVSPACHRTDTRPGASSVTHLTKTLRPPR
jgi:hypothetical protein